MSYVYDVMSRAFATHMRPLLEEKGKGDLAYRFERLIDDMHEANHKVPSADGIFEGDGINKDDKVHKAAVRLDKIESELRKAEKAAAEEKARLEGERQQGGGA